MARVGRRAGRDGERGAAMVEFALLVPLLFMLLLGMFSGGLAYNTRLQLTQSSREAARYGAVLPADASLPAGATWVSTVRDYAWARSAGELSSTSGTTCVSLVQGSGAGTAVVTTPSRNASFFSTTGSPCIANEVYPTTATDNGRRVQVVVTKPARIEAVLFSRNITIRSAFTARQEVDP